MKLLISIMTCNKTQKRRDIIRNTWLKNCNTDYLFFSGKGSSTETDVIFLDCKYNYNTCDIKQYKILEYCYNNLEFDYIFQCDDDTYVLPERLENCGYQFFDYMGFPGDDLGMRYALGGSGFFLSKSAINSILHSKHLESVYGKIKFSDLFVGKILAEENIKLKVNLFLNPGKYQEGVGFTQLLPTKENGYITSHYLTEEMMYKVYNHFNNDEKISNFYRTRGIEVFEMEGKWYYNDGKINGPFFSSWQAEADKFGFIYE